MNINLFNFFQVSGGFAVEKRVETLTLGDGSTVETGLLTIGGMVLITLAGMLVAVPSSKPTSLKKTLAA